MLNPDPDRTNRRTDRWIANEDWCEFYGITAIVGPIYTAVPW